MVDAASLEKAISDLRELKSELSNRVNVIMLMIEEGYKATITAIDSYLSKLANTQDLLQKKDKVNAYYDCLDPLNPLNSYIEIPKFLKPGPKIALIANHSGQNHIKYKPFKCLTLEKPEGFFNLPDIKTCNHSFSYYYRTTCKNLHCFKCLKETTDPELIETILKNIPKGSEIKDTHTKIECCPQGKLTKRDIFIIKSKIK